MLPTLKRFFYKDPPIEISPKKVYPPDLKKDALFGSGAATIKTIQWVEDLPPIGGARGPYSAIVYIDGTDIIAEDAIGTEIASGLVATPADVMSVMMAAIAVGGRVFVGPGSYTLEDLQMATDTHLIGSKNKTKIILKASSSYCAIVFSSIHDASIEAIEIDGNKASESDVNHAAVFINSSYNCGIRNCYIHDSLQDGILIAESGSYDNIIENNYIYNCDGDGVGTLRSSKNTITQNIITSCTISGVHVYSDSHYNIVSKNRISGSAGEGIVIGPSNNTLWVPSNFNSIHDNIIDQSGTMPFGIQLIMFSYGNKIINNIINLNNYVAYGGGIANYVNSSSGYMQNAPHKNNISGNTINCLFTDESAGAYSYGIYSVFSPFVDIKNNTILCNGHLAQGIHVIGGADGDGYVIHNLGTELSGNSVFAPKDIGIYVTQNHCRVIGNKLFKGNYLLNDVGIEIESDYCDVVDNDISYFYYGIYLHGTDAHIGNRIFRNRVYASGLDTVLISNVSSSATVIYVYDPAIFDIGDRIHIADSSTPAGEDAYVLTIEDGYVLGKKITLTSGLANAYTMAHSATVALKNDMVRCLVITSGHDYVQVYDNSFRDSSSASISNAGGTNIKFDRNIGHVTENSGTSTGTGSAQTIAHGLAAAPSKVWIWAIADPAGTTITKGSPGYDATNINLTVTNGKTFGWMAVV